MSRITFYGWRVGMRGIPFVLLLREHACLTLKQAWAVKQSVLDGVSAVVEVPSAASYFVSSQAQVLGVDCVVE